MSDRPEWMNLRANYPHGAARPPEHKAWCSARCNIGGCERPHVCSCHVDNPQEPPAESAGSRPTTDA